MSSDAARELVTAMILDRPLCSICIAERTFLDQGTVQVTLAAIADMPGMWVGAARCAGCRTVQPTFKLARDASRS